MDSLWGHIAADGECQHWVGWCTGSPPFPPPHLLPSLTPVVPTLVTPYPPSCITHLAQGPVLDDMCQSSSQEFCEALFPYLIKLLVCCVNILPSQRIQTVKISEEKDPRPPSSPHPILNWPLPQDHPIHTLVSVCPVFAGEGWMGHARCIQQYILESSLLKYVEICLTLLK